MPRVASVIMALARVIIIRLFRVGVGLFWGVEVHGLERDPLSPRTYFAMSHKRDLDAMISVSVMLTHRGWRALAGDVHFAMRADSFTPGFLARVVRRPPWLSWLLRPITVGRILLLAGVHPLAGPYTRPGEEWIRDVLAHEGNPPVGEVLAAPFLARLAAETHQPPEQLAQRPLAQLLYWRYQEVFASYLGPEVLAPDVRRAARRRLVALVKRQIEDLAAQLWQGGSLYGSPEGGLSPDGRISSITSGWHRLLRAAPADTTVLPVYTMYDFMTVRRPRLFIDVAPAIERAPALPHDEQDARLREAWLGAARFTCSQLASGFLVRRSEAGAAPFTLEDLATAVRRDALALVAVGLHIDRRMLRQRSARWVAAGYLAYVARRGLVQRAGQGRWIPTVGSLKVAVPVGEVGYRDLPLAYAWNELQQLLAQDPAASEPLPDRSAADG
jgi:hypothetical protein